MAEDIKVLSPEERKKLEDEILAQAAGGTRTEDNELLVWLLCAGKGSFIKDHYDGEGTLDYNKVSAFFASKGYKFIPGGDHDQNVFIGPDGLRYGNDYMVYMLQNKMI